MIVCREIMDFDKNDGFGGLSLVSLITAALRREGLLPVGREEDGCCDVCGMILDTSGCPRCDGDDA